MFLRADWVKAAATRPQTDSAPDKISLVISCLCAPKPHPEEFITRAPGRQRRGKKRVSKDRYEIKAECCLDKGKVKACFKTIAAILKEVRRKKKGLLISYNAAEHKL